MLPEPESVFEPAFEPAFEPESPQSQSSIKFLGRSSLTSLPKTRPKKQTKTTTKKDNHKNIPKNVVVFLLKELRQVRAAQILCRRDCAELGVNFESVLVLISSLTISHLSPYKLNRYVNATPGCKNCALKEVFGRCFARFMEVSFEAYVRHSSARNQEEYVKFGLKYLANLRQAEPCPILETNTSQ